jgi:hypothetical protein
MNLRRLQSLPASMLIIRCAAWLVPARERSEWRAEWEAELCYVWRANGSNVNLCAQEDVTRFCMGAFHDAFWLRCDCLRSSRGRVLRPGSASRCSLMLAMWVAASLLVCISLPGARKVVRRSFYRDTDGLVMIARGGYSGMQTPTIGLDEYLSWKTATQHLFSNIAFYQPMVKRVHVANHRGAELSIGRASGNLFQLLNLPISADRPGNEHVARLFLTRTAWRENFAGDPNIIGTTGDLAGQKFVVAGVVSRDSWQLPGHLDAWLLEDDRQLATLAKKPNGFLLARKRNGTAFPFPDRPQHMTVYNEEGIGHRFDCISLAEQARLPFSIFLFSLIIALIALPATTPLPLGEYPHHHGRLPVAVRARRWIFLWCKILLLIPLVYCTSLDAAYGVQIQSADTAQYIQLTISFFGFLFGFRWILQDQRKRCPVCLRMLSSPARVGEASRNFLAWNGTELICAGGHGLLHIPELPTSWFSTQRWLDLDASWDTLFTDGYVPSAGVV